MPRDFASKPEDAPGRRRPSARKYPREEAPPKSADLAGRSGQSPDAALEADIMSLDEELIRLLVRRSSLLGKLRRGKKMASTPAASASEKLLRGNWEEKAGQISRNPRFIRQLFNLVQELDLRPSGREQEGSPFNLAPARSPVKIKLPGPPLVARTQLWLALLAAAGRKARFTGLSPVPALRDTVQALAQCGARLDWTGPDTLVLDASGLPSGSSSSPLSSQNAKEGGNRLNYHAKAIFAGEDLLTFYLLAFLALSRPGRVRFIGGLSLKEADLGAFGHLVPLLGARLAWLIPASKGLPASLECSGDLPESLEAPADLPPEGLLALLAAPLAWRADMKISLSAVPEETRRRVLALLRPLLRDFSGNMRLGGSSGEYADEILEYSFTKGDEAAPPPNSPFSAGGVPGRSGSGARESLPEIKPRLDPHLCAFWLAFPLFTGGSVSLEGTWDNSPETLEVRRLFAPFPLEIREDARSVSGTAPQGGSWPEKLEMEALSPPLHPLFWLLNARLARKSGTEPRLKSWPYGADLDLAEEFLAQAGFSLLAGDQELILKPLDEESFKTVSSKTRGWVCPEPGWGLALSLAAFMRANLKLGNPGCVREVLPYYWQIYNSLPCPDPKAAAGAPPRSRAPDSSGWSCAPPGEERPSAALPEPAPEPAGARKRIRTEAAAELRLQPPPRSHPDREESLPENLPELQARLSSLEEEQKIWQDYITALSNLENPGQGVFHAAELHAARQYKLLLAWKQDSCRVRINQLKYGRI
ncbi:MAG: hypothetical protein LBQ63_03260 [Deltaproteobacteria bacterium]|jgi:hypothetical protein|nr:hypothetical protein [Deltaproteobacteria bacterium]